MECSERLAGRCSHILSVPGKRDQCNYSSLCDPSEYAASPPESYWYLRSASVWQRFLSSPQQVLHVSWLRPGMTRPAVACGDLPERRIQVRSEEGCAVVLRCLPRRGILTSWRMAEAKRNRNLVESPGQAIWPRRLLSRNVVYQRPGQERKEGDRSGRCRVCLRMS